MKNLIIGIINLTISIILILIFLFLAIAGAFGLLMLKNIKERYDSGERTQKLYDEMMEIE